MDPIILTIEDPGTAILVNESLDLFEMSLVSSVSTLEMLLAKEKDDDVLVTLADELEGANRALNKIRYLQRSLKTQMDENEAIKEYLL